MQLTVFTDCRFTQTTDGSVCSSDGVNGYRRWSRYLGAFDRIVVVGRLFGVASASATPVRGLGVDFFGLPGYQGLADYLRKARSIGMLLDEVAAWPGTFLLRTPGNISRLAWPRLMKRVRPYGVEVAGDPYDVFARGAFRHPLRPLLRRLGVAAQRKQVLHAQAAHYVTERYLQERYPTRGYAGAASDVDLADDAYAPGPRTAPAKGVRRLVFVGTFDALYKAPDVLLHAVRRCVSSGLDLQLEFVGDGLHRHAMETLAAALGLAARVLFHGRVRAGHGVRAILDRADLFVHPSRTEGLPRAIIEAMARGLPCIASRVGGIPELLAEDDLFAPGDVDDLSRKLVEVLSAPERMTAASARNLERARCFSATALARRRLAIYDELMRRAAAAPHR